MKKIIKKLKNFIKPKDKEVKIKWSLYSRVWKEIGLPYWKWLLAGVICTIIAASAEGYSVTLVKKVIDKGFVSQNMDSLMFIGLEIILAFLLKGLFNYAKSLIMSKTGLKTASALQERIYEHTIRTNIDAVQGDGMGRFMNYFGGQAGAVLNLVTTQVIKIVQDAASLIIMIGLMLWFAPQLVAILLFLIPMLFIPMILITRYKNKKTREMFRIANTSGQHINQSLHGIKTIQAFGMEKYQMDKFHGILQDSIKNSYKTTRVDSLRSPLMELVISVGLGISLIIAGHFISSGEISIGDFTAFILALTAAYKPAKNATSINNGLQQGLIAAEILFEFLDSKPKVMDSKNAVPLTDKKMKVTFKNVSFAYQEADGDVLHDINLEANPEKVCAFVGPSGGGKTTMFNLLERFYDPSKGTIMINDKDIKKYTLSSLRNNIAEVSQDVFLFNASIEENIGFGAPGATHEQIVEAAKIANAHDFIMKLPHQYKTNVGERGSLLSGGQKQRVAIARAVLKNAPILLLDEATSALDTESEKLIQSALNKLMVGRTVFVIAHRLSTILDADTIFVIKDGRIIESGTDAELVKKNGEYKKLRDIQFK
jgi:subfamily B ATP-binding cassette protein MsbA